MITHCKSELPFEGCGLLSGRAGIAESIWPMENMDRSPNSYSMNLDQIQRVFNLINSKSEDLVGIYHSHPTDKAYPSFEDIAYNNYPEVAHIIISFANYPSQPDIKAFQLKEDKVIPLSIEGIN